MLIGRDGDLRSLTAAWRRRRRGVLVTGPPGIGRTAFAAGAAAALRSEGADVMHVRGTATSRAVRLWALAPHLVDGAPERAADLGDEVRSALMARATGRFVAVVDDAHVLDDASARLLAELLDTPHGFLVATADERLVGGPLLSHPELERLALAPLDRDAVARVLLAHGVHDLDADAAHQRCRGNPTALVRLLALTRARRVALQPADGNGRMPADDPMELVLAGLSAEARRLLDVIAVAEPVALVAAGAVSGDGDGASIDELVASGLVESSADAVGEVQLRFVHPADAELVVAMMPPLRTRWAVRAAVRAAAATTRSRTPESLVRLASLATRVGEELGSHELRAATAAARTGDDGDVALRLARCTATATGAYEDVRVWADLAYERGHLAELDVALDRLRRLVDCDEEHERTRRITSLAVASAERALWRGAAATAALDALTALDGVDHDGRDELLAIRARVMATVGMSTDALAVAEPLLVHANARVRAQAATAVCHARRRLGSPTAGVAALDAVLAAPGADDTVLLVSRQVLGSVRSLALTEAGRWHDAEAAALDARTRADRSDDRAGRAVATLVLATAMCGRGHITDAIDAARRSLALFEHLAQPAGVRWAWSVIGVAAGLGGDAATTLTATDRLRDLPPHPATLLPAMEALAHAWAAAHTSATAARERLACAAVELTATGDVGAAGQCLHELAVLGGAPEALDALDGLSVDHDEPVHALRRAHLEALATDDHVSLGALAETYADRGGDRWAVECAAAAAAVAARIGDRRAATQWASEAVRRASECAGLATPGLAGARVVHGGASPLTARERDVALLAARGMPSREIADRLQLSVRTVDNHLARCFDKLGVRTRGELPPLLGVDP